MSTTISGRPTWPNMYIDAYTTDSGDHVEVTATLDGAERGTTVPRADFLAAVEAELGVIVIDRAELPEVAADGDGLRAGNVKAVGWQTADDARHDALGLLAISEHLRANPPIDEAQVEAMAAVVGALPATLFDPTTSAPEVARRLIATGRVHVDVEGAK